MKYVSQVLLILLFTFLGEVLHALIPLPIPASIYGMVLLFAALWLKLIPAAKVRDAGGFLTSILPLLFVAPAVSLLDCWDLLKNAIVPICLILLLTTVLTFGISGRLTQWFIRRKEGRKDA